ncbi:hypothetical protein T08_5990 [Trichinella sp. T8]|nr:hypothetical protein T08_5990 [Trichinella sp. T8]
MLQTHKYHINRAITETCIKQPITISYMLEIICMLKVSKEGSVENAYMGLTEEERQHVSRRHCFTCTTIILKFRINFLTVF